MTENLKGMDTFKISIKVAYIQFLPNFEHLSLFFFFFCFSSVATLCTQKNTLLWSSHASSQSLLSRSKNKINSFLGLIIAGLVNGLLWYIIENDGSRIFFDISCVFCPEQQYRSSIHLYILDQTSATSSPLWLLLRPPLSIS